MRTYDYVLNPGEYDRAEPAWWAIDLCNEPVRPLRELTIADPEVWMSISGFEGLYEVSSHGRVRSRDRIRQRECPSNPGVFFSQPHRGRVLTPYVDKHARVHVHLRNREMTRTRRIPVLVAETFIGPRPYRKLVLHGNGRPGDNWPANLRYGTHEDNVADAHKHGTWLLGDRQKRAKLTAETAGTIKALRGRFTIGELSRALKVSKTCVQMVRDGRNWRWVEALSLDAAIAVYDRHAADAEIDRREQPTEGAAA